ncbi:hypothetical protein PTSG_10535 [Salpingoeca rosetta]|uniref:Uncharacterized protein n=1 Tax=Salpingoeca rosetta (strain ATCC 50818 / BSB-021) TaxID=946362 RepID=F2URM5_SALR5|nr:uncharacterized protein PTSG_10535 [Salpingoeca rosetta]EGD80280.1 hypothetical protein PTSG_10535 [Salpingoeca rosetta]|eukprot:XP_004988070.1 hypothetical protein PTSG_10535 [Salpingoeca rosetta]
MASPATMTGAARPIHLPVRRRHRAPSTPHQEQAQEQEQHQQQERDTGKDVDATKTPPTLMEEIRALLHSDLGRMPDVVDFIRKHAHNIDSLPRVALMNMRDLSNSFIKKIAHLPAVESVLIDYLMAEDEQWAAYLTEQFKSGVAFVDAFQQGLYSRFPSWTVPETITRRLASMPAVKQAVVSYLTSMEATGGSLLRRVVAKNVEHMRDLQSLVARHLDSLPTLKQLREAHYEGIPELKHFDYSVSRHILGAPRPHIDTLLISGPFA